MEAEVEVVALPLFVAQQVGVVEVVQFVGREVVLSADLLALQQALVLPCAVQPADQCRPCVLCTRPAEGCTFLCEIWWLTCLRVATHQTQRGLCLRLASCQARFSCR